MARLPVGLEAASVRADKLRRCSQAIEGGVRWLQFAQVEDGVAVARILFGIVRLVLGGSQLGAARASAGVSGRCLLQKDLLCLGCWMQAAGLQRADVLRLTKRSSLGRVGCAWAAGRRQLGCNL